MLKELKAFLFKGDVLNLAVAVIVGAAFKAIIDSLIENIITPVLLTPALKAAGVEKIAELSWNGIAYGSFLSAVINFLVVGTVLFFVVKASEKALAITKKAEAEAEEVAPAGPTQEELLAEIRDLLKK